MEKAKKIGKVLLRILGFLLVLTAFDQEFSSVATRTKGNSPILDLLFGVLILSFTLPDKERRRRDKEETRSHEEFPLGKRKNIGIVLLRIWGALLVIQGFLFLTGVLPPLATGNFVPTLTIMLGIWIWYNPVEKFLSRRLRSATKE